MSKYVEEVYRPKSPDEQKFVDKHVTIKHKDRNGNDDDVFNASKIKTIKRKEERHGYDAGDDEKVYENADLSFFDELLEMDLDEDTFTDASIANLHVIKHKQFIKKIEQSDNPIKKVKLLRDARKKLADLEAIRDNHVAKYNATKNKRVAEMADPENEDQPPFPKPYAKTGPRKDRYGNMIKNMSKHLAKKGMRANEEHEIDALLDEALDILNSIDEKTLTPAELKKREEVVKAIKRGNPKMDKSMAYAIATKTAKRVAEESEELDELSRDTLSSYAGKASDARGHRKLTTKKVDNRYTGVARAQDRLTKEDIINNAIEKYTPKNHEMPSLDEQFIQYIENLPDSQAFTLASLFEALTEENKVNALEVVKTESGLNELLDFTIERRDRLVNTFR